MFRKIRVFLITGIAAIAITLMILPAARQENHKPVKMRVPLFIKETAGADRTREPVTSGVPLPTGQVTNCSDLLLVDESRREIIPCQFAATAKWPDGSIKWVLLDFDASVAANTRASYALCNYAPAECASGSAPIPEDRVHVEDKKDEVEVNAGRLSFAVSKRQGTLLDRLTVDGVALIVESNKCESVIVLEGGHPAGTACCFPDIVEIEAAGPLVACIKTQGRFLDARKKPICGGRIGYTSRVTAYAGRPYIKLAFTLRNDTPFTAHKKNRWLHMESWSLRFPVSPPKGEDSQWAAATSDGHFEVQHGERLSLNQWLEYIDYNCIGWTFANSTNDEKRIAMAGERDPCIANPKLLDIRMIEQSWRFFYLVSQDGNLRARGIKAKGWMSLFADRKPLISVFVHKFWQNFPRGLSAKPGELTVSVLPKGGFWPRTKEMAAKEIYVMDGARNKTVEMLVWCGDAPSNCNSQLAQTDYPLFARAPLSWYRDTGAVWPIADTGIETGRNAETDEAIARYDLLQLAKVHQEKGDPPGPIKLGIHEWTDDHWDNMSIPRLREYLPGVLYGWMNFGDLVWSWGYCSLHYDWPYGMLLQHLRFEDPEMFDLGDEMARHRYDIDRGYYGFQHYEKGFHGDRTRIGRRQYNAGYNAQPTHTWNRGLLLHWALTGNPNSFEQAKHAGNAFADILRKVEKQQQPSQEFRLYAWAIDGCLAVYEYTGEKQYLDCAYAGFVHSLLLMEKANGSKGHIIKDGKQSAQFISYLVLPIIRLHHLTKKQDVAEFLKRVLDWQREHGTTGGVMHGQKYIPLRFANMWNEGDPLATTMYNFQFADGYAYLHKTFGREEDIQFARKVFKDGMFYYGGQEWEKDPAYRTPLGYHFRGCMDNFCSKMHGFSTRYGQVYLQVEQSIARE